MPFLQNVQTKQPDCIILIHFVKQFPKLHHVASFRTNFSKVVLISIKWHHLYIIFFNLNYYVNITRLNHLIYIFFHISLNHTNIHHLKYSFFTISQTPPHWTIFLKILQNFSKPNSCLNMNSIQIGQIPTKFYHLTHFRLYFWLNSTG